MSAERAEAQSREADGMHVIGPHTRTEHGMRFHGCGPTCAAEHHAGMAHGGEWFCGRITWNDIGRIRYPMHGAESTSEAWNGDVTQACGPVAHVAGKGRGNEPTEDVQADAALVDVGNVATTGRHRARKHVRARHQPGDDLETGDAAAIEGERQDVAPADVRAGTRGEEHIAAPYEPPPALVVGCFLAWATGWGTMAWHLAGGDVPPWWAVALALVGVAGMSDLAAFRRMVSHA